MLLEKHNPMVSKDFNASDKEILAYILFKPKRFREFDNNDKNDFLNNLIMLYSILGIKDIPSTEHNKFLVNLIVNEYPTFNKYEFDKAINMAIMGKLEVENNPYQALTPMYISNIIKAYKNKRQNIYQKYKQLQGKLEREKPTKSISKKEQFFIALNLVESEYNHYVEDTKTYENTEFRDTQFKYIYNFLRDNKIIKTYIYKTNDELKKYIVSWFKAINKRDTSPTLYIKNILSKK